MLGGLKTLMVTALAGRLYYLQVIEGEKYRLLSDENRINHRILFPPRGLIVDRFGIPMATNSPSYRAILVAEQTPNLKATLEAFSAIVPLSERDIAKQMKERQHTQEFKPITVKDDLNWEEVNAVELNLPGPSRHLDRDRPEAGLSVRRHHLAHPRLRRGAERERRRARSRSAAEAARLPHRQERAGAQIRLAAARRRRRKPARGQSVRPRDPRTGAPGGPARRRPRHHARHRPAPVRAPAPVERDGGRGGGDGRLYRRPARAGLDAVLRPDRVLSRPHHRRVAGAEQRHLRPAHQQGGGRPVRAGLDLQDDHGAGGPAGRRQPERPRLLQRRHRARLGASSTAGNAKATARST